MFGLLLKNRPETSIKGGITSGGRIEYYYQAFGGLTLLFVEVKYSLYAGGPLRNSQLAQVMAECEGICSTSPTSCCLTVFPFMSRCSTPADGVYG
jgi:hypothetical protein